MNQSENDIYVKLLQDIADMHYEEDNSGLPRLRGHSLDISGKTRVVSIVSFNPARIIELAALEGLYGAKFFQIGNEWAVYWSHPVFSDELYAKYGEAVDPN